MTTSEENLKATSTDVTVKASPADDVDISELPKSTQNQITNFLRSVEARYAASHAPASLPAHDVGGDPGWFNPETHDRSTSEAMKTARDFPFGAPEIPLSPDGPWISLGKRGLYIRTSGNMVLVVQGSWIDSAAQVVGA